MRSCRAITQLQLFSAIKGNSYLLLALWLQEAHNGAKKTRKRIHAGGIADLWGENGIFNKY